MTRTDGSRQYFFSPSGRTFLAALILASFASATAFAGPTGKMGPTNASAPQGEVAPNATFTTVDGKIIALKGYAGHPVVVWQVTTWCPSCKAGLETFAHHESEIDKSDITVLVLRDYQNGGYPGPTMRKFAESVAPKLLHDPHFVFGEDTKALFDLYNPHKFIDVYQVIGADGHIALVSSTPSATFDKIQSFLKAKTGS